MQPREAALGYLRIARSPDVLGEKDAAALRAICIDLDAVRSSAAESFDADVFANQRGYCCLDRRPLAAGCIRRLPI
ncbi:hypothetical protein ONR57_00265 [Hoyosella sp. YIM 151337]|uniref:hypothetical protein n=1 Tax=Hoyosella sp. YIM 151337 TaxID=2992742 RepID=UPI00223599B6|nr:hypothetical protein [Hoyosella sp. YIM 151337]MCW4351737.1 hypothetical protein [Hoyosella sp. YIM 151337]